LRTYIEEYVRAKEEMPESPLPAEKFMERLNTCHWHEWENLSFPLRLYRALKDFLSHKWMYDRESLMALLKDAGFEGVSEKGFLDSAIPVMADVERKDRFDTSVCVEGFKR